MSDTRDGRAASEAARELVRHRWGNRVVVRAAATVIERAGELPDEMWAALVAAREGSNGE